MTPVRWIRPWLLAACAAAGCTTTPTPTQVLTGSVAATGAIAVRAVSSDAVVTAAQVRSDGTFTLALPGNAQYRLEILTATGVKPMYAKSGTSYRDLQFKVCQPQDPYDMGTVGDPMSGGGGQPCDPTTDPNCKPPPPPPCDPMTDPSCAMPCDAAGNCPPGCDPNTDPTCKPPPPPPCDPGTGMNCPPPPPDCSNGGPNCPPPKCDPTSTDPGTACPQPCDPSTDSTCVPPPPPPCMDPTDPTTCKDPCMDDPANCGCASTDPNCWPMPTPPPCDASGNCSPGDGGGMCPDHPPTDIGCDDPNGGTDAGTTTMPGTPGG